MEVRSTSAVAEFVRLLGADAGIRQRTMDRDAVYAHRLPEPPTDTAWARLCVRELALPQGMPEHPSGLVQVQVQVMAETSGAPDPDLLLESIHERAKQVLTGKTFDTRHGATYLAVERYARHNPAQWDAKAHCFYSTSTYLLTLNLG